MRLFIMLMLTFSQAWAEDTAIAHNSSSEPKVAVASSGVLESSQLSAQLLQLVMGLLLVIGLIFLLAWIVRRVQQSLPVKGSQRAISLLATQALGPRDRLLLVQVGKEQILLGLTPGTIVPLHVLQEPVEVTGTEPNVPSAFAQRLTKVLKNSAKEPQ